MKLVLFCHPAFLQSQSMPRFAQMLRSAYQARGFEVETWTPTPRFYRLCGNRFAKWGGYIDQYLIFPMRVRRLLKSASPDSLFIFCDQALGPWVPLVKERPHVVHAHDLLSLRSALGEIPENATSLSGRLYQKYIRRGFQNARHFISVSKKTRDDLHRYGGVTPLTSEVVYNGLNFPYDPLPRAQACRILSEAGLPCGPDGMLLHVGGAQWYKNRLGILAVYSRYALETQNPLPLWCIGPPPTGAVAEAWRKVPANGRVLFFQNLENRTLQAAYSLARVFLFPSFGEGFGWPLVEAQSCGCPVITTDEAPMNEVAGGAARYIPRLARTADLEQWAIQGAAALREVLALDAAAREQLAQRGRAWTQQFDAARAIDRYLEIYQRVFDAYAVRTSPGPAFTHGTKV
jgi:glycosyltransferase involved in cell wall biosynthesis